MSNSPRRYGLFDFTDYIGKRVVDFTGREWVFQEIGSWLKQSNASRYFLITGEPGSGKRAVTARLAQFSAGEVPQPPGCQHLTPAFLRAVHFCSTTADDWLDPRTFARSLALQLSSIDQFQVAPQSYLLELRPRANSRPVAFQATSSRTGKRSLLVNAYQEDSALAAQTRLTIQVLVAITPDSREGR